MEKYTKLEKEKSGFPWGYVALFVGVVLVFLIVIGVTVALILTQPTNPNAPVDCGDHGTYAFFADPQCICDNGWTGELCADAASAGEYYPVVYLESASRTTSVLNITFAACNATCMNNTDCRGVIYNDCYADYCNTKRCQYLFDQDYRRYPNLWVQYPEVGHQVAPFDEDRVYLRNPGKCTAPFCYYNEKYGIVRADTDNYVYTRFGMEMQVFYDMNLTRVGELVFWSNLTAAMNNYAQVPKRLRNVAEFTQSGLLQLKRILSDDTYTVDSMTVVSTKTSFFQSITNSDYGMTYKGIELQFDERDLGSQFLPAGTEAKYDVVILTDVVYHQKNIAVFLTNVWTLLKAGGTLIMRETEWISINETVVVNYCMGAGMPKKALIDAYLDQFTPVYLSADPEVIEPSLLETGSFFDKSIGCWGLDVGVIPPNHSRKYVSYVGRK